MKTVPLRGKNAAGRVALVDDEDYELVSHYSWRVQEKPQGRGISGPYAVRSRPKRGANRTIFMHKFITGWPVTDHINHDGLDNRRSNLRPATRSQNQHNQRPQPGGSSRYKGVYRATQGSPWAAHIKQAGRQRYLGKFESEIEAARAYDTAARELFGEYACLNFPDLAPFVRPVRRCLFCAGPLLDLRRTKYCSTRCQRDAENLRTRQRRSDAGRHPRPRLVGVRRKPELS